MELSYPNIPGLGRFSDYQNLDPSLQIGFILSYIFKLVFFISIGAGLIALLTAGVLYIVSSSKPRFLILAKQMASNAMLGLFILLCAYLLLYVINPQLLNLTLTKPKLDKIASNTTNQFGKDTVVAQEVRLSENLTNAVANLEEKVHLALNSKNEPIGQYAEKINGNNKYCLTDGYEGAMNLSGKYLKDIEDKNDADKKSGCVVAGVVDESRFVYRAEIPLRETAEALKIIAPLVDELKITLEKCKCGMSLGYSDWSEGKCMPGLNPDSDEYLTKKDGPNFCLNQADDCGTKPDGNALACDLRDVRKNLETGFYEVCQKNQPGACGEKDNCWIQVEVKGVGGVDIKEFGPKPNGDSTCGVAVKVANLVQLKVIKIQEQQAKMQARSRIDARFLDSATLIARALTANGDDFAISQATGDWQFAASKRIQDIQDAGYNVVIQDSKDAGDTTAPNPTTFNTPKKNGFFARLKSLFSPLAVNFAWAQSMYDKEAITDAFLVVQAARPGSFFYITTAPGAVQDPEITAKNKAIARDARRYNLFSLLTDLPLEGIETIFRDCLTAAFGVANYELDQDQIQDVITAVMASGAGDHFKAVVQEMIDKQRIAEAAAKGTTDAIADDATVAFIKPFLEKCRAANPNCPEPSTEEAQKFVKSLFDKTCSITKVLTGPCCYCVKNLMSNGVPPNYLSKTFSAVFTTSLQDKLPEINKILETKLIDTLFPQDDPDHPIGKFLDTPSKEIYDAIFKGALMQPFDTMIPGLDKLLDKQMQDVLPDFIVNQIVKINTWFENTVASSTSNIKRASNFLANRLIDEYVAQPLAQWTANWWEAHGVGAETIKGCFDKFAGNQVGYIYKANNGQYTLKDFKGDIKQYEDGFVEYCKNTSKNLKPKEPGKCFKMTPEEITILFGGKTKIPKSFNYGGQLNCGDGVAVDDMFEITMGESNFFEVNSFSVPTICENSGYAWDKDLEKCEHRDDIAKDIASAGEAIANIDKQDVEGALINYGEKMAVAFTETALQFALAYARVFVEDNFIAPLMTYWNAISGFQKGMHDFLTTSVKGILPAQISGLLESNIVEQIDEFCKQYKAAKEAMHLTEEQKANPKFIITLDFTITLKGGVRWKDSSSIIQPVDMPQETGDAICKIDKALNTTPWEEITEMCKSPKPGFEERLCGETGVVGILRNKLIDTLDRICITEDKCFDIGTWFGKPLLSIFFPHYDGKLQDLIKATPKDLLCGETNVFDAKVLCPPIISAQYGIIPVFKPNLNKAQEDLKPWCAFVYSACQLPVEAKTTVGEFIATIVNKSCIAYCTPPKETENLCKSCDALRNHSIFYSLFGSEFDDTKVTSLVGLLNSLNIQEPTLRTMLNQKEILGKTPYQALVDYVCDSNKDEGTDEYALCEILNKTPQQMMGLDKPLKEFIRPEEFIILFDMLQKDLKDGSASNCQKNEVFHDENGQAMCCDERMAVGKGLCYKVGEKPAGLKQLLNFMETSNPIDFLIDLQQTMPKNSQPNQSPYPYAFYFSADAANNPTCLGIGNKISACSSPTPQILSGYGISGNAFIEDVSEEKKADFEYETFISKDNILGIVRGADTKGGQVIYYLVETSDQSNLVFAFKGPTNSAKDAFGNALSFMTTDIGVVANKILGSGTIADYICDNIAMDVAYWPEANGFGSDIRSICDVPIVEGWKNLKFSDNIKLVKEILSSTPLDLVAKYLTKPMTFANCRPKPLNSTCKQGEKLNDKKDQCCTEISFMDMASANTALGQPLIDTLGALTGLDKIIKGEADSIFGKANKVFDWAERGAKAGVGAIQDGLNNALYEWPKSMAPEWLANFYGFNVGDNAADDMAGACYDKLANKDCKTDKGEILKPAADASSKDQCCILAKGESCQPRCREVDALTKQCDILSGERAKVEQRIIDGSVRYICCFAGVAGVDDTGVGFQDSEEMNCFAKPADGACAYNEIINPKNDKQCCLPTIKLCKKARAVNFSAGGKCRTQNENGDAGGTYETAEGSGENGICKFVEDYRQTLPPAPANAILGVEDQGFCCSTVGQCIANRFSSHLENLAEMLADGNIPLQSLKK